MSDVQVTQEIPYLRRRAIVPALPDLGEDPLVLTAAPEHFEQGVEALTTALQQFEQDASAVTPTPPKLAQNISALTTSLQKFGQDVSALTTSTEQFEQDAAQRVTALQLVGQEISTLVAVPQLVVEDAPVSTFATAPQQVIQDVQGTAAPRQLGQVPEFAAPRQLRHVPEFAAPRQLGQVPESAAPRQLGQISAFAVPRQVQQEVQVLDIVPQRSVHGAPQPIAALHKSAEAAKHIIALIIVLIQQVLSAKGVTRVPILPDLDNVQGDVYFMFPKRWERFLFFRISDVTKFREDLGKYAPRITSSKQTYDYIHHIQNKGGRDRNCISTGIAFARAGLHKLGITEKLGDSHFDKGSQFDERDALGDKGRYDAPFNASANTDGVILVTARDRNTCEKQTNDIKDIFNGSIDVLKIYEGHVRNDKAEHFGYRDGISQPALAGISKPKPGQRLVKPGVIILGYPGDPLCGARPSFTKDGSFLTFRKLEQNPLFFDYYIDQHWRTIPAAPDPDHRVDLNEEERKALFGARLFGRFKSGVPLALRPYKDDPHFDPDLLNAFDYTERPAEYGCPWAAHVRKTAPRNLKPIVSKEFLDASVIVRAGIPYGDDPTPEEREKFDKLTREEKADYQNERGLLFVSYQSSIGNGFFRQATEFGNNDWFPLTGLVPNKIGQDPIIGGPQPEQKSTGKSDISKEGEVTLEVINPSNVQYKVSGIAKKVDTSATAFVQEYFVTSRGGEWYFVPSISTAKAWAQPKAN